MPNLERRRQIVTDNRQQYIDDPADRWLDNRVEYLDDPPDRLDNRVTYLNADEEVKYNG